MRNYIFFAVLCGTAFTLSGCAQDRVNNVIYNDVPSPLTKMTYSTELPPETYSQYMETYTRDPETDTEDSIHSRLRADGIIADTGVTKPAKDGGEMQTLPRDTAVTAVTTVPTLPEYDFQDTSTETASAFSDNAEETSRGGLIRETAVTLERPAADTRGSENSISADTRPTRAENTSAETTESGTSSTT